MACNRIQYIGKLSSNWLFSMYKVSIVLEVLCYVIPATNSYIGFILKSNVKFYIVGNLVFIFGQYPLVHCKNVFPQDINHPSNEK